MKKVSSIGVMPLALAVTTLIAVPSFAQEGGKRPGAGATTNLDATSLFVSAGPRASINGDDGGIAGASSLTQNFETGFTAGAGCGQNGWAGFCGAGPPPVGFLIIANSPPDPVFGAFSALHQSDGSGIAGNEIISPASPAAEVGRVDMDVRISDTLSGYGIATGNCVTAGCLINTRVFFNANGNIEVLQLTPGNCTTGVFADSGADWTPGVTFRLGIEVDGLGGLKIYKNNALIFTGTDIAVSCTPANPPGIRSLSVFAQNTAGATASTLLLDNIGPPATACAGNTNGDANVDVNDLLAVVTTWGACPGCPPATCVGDIFPAGGNCLIDVNDLLEVISHWGPCP